MPAQLSYPGVYVEEIPSGVRTIIGVSTSVTAFIGRAIRGPVNTPTDIFSFEAFTRQFGGIWAPSTLGYAVHGFFLNGGGHAVIVRLHNGATTATITGGGLTLEAASPGVWGADLRLQIDLADIDTDLAQQLGTTLFTLRVRESRSGGAVETFHNLSVEDNYRNIGRVLELESELVRLPAGANPSVPTEGFDTVSDLEQKLAEARKPKPDGSGPVGDVAAAEKALHDKVDEVRAAVKDGDALSAAHFIGDTLGAHEGLHALDVVDGFNLLCIPPHKHEGNGTDLEQMLIASAVAYCEKRRAMMIIDPRAAWKDPVTATKASAWVDQIGSTSPNAALFFPRLRQLDPERGNVVMPFAPCGAVAGVFARTDASRGVWKAPAGLEASLVGVPELSVKIDDDVNGLLNPLGINCLRSFPVTGRVVWGARTRAGADLSTSEWKYIPIRRLALYIEESLYRGTQWVVFEPNDEPLWAQIRLNVGAFMHDLFRQGAFAGAKPADAYLVRCDKDTTTQSDRDRGIVNIVVGFAPLKPAEFVIIRLQQLAGQIET